MDGMGEVVRCIDTESRAGLADDGFAVGGVVACEYLKLPRVASIELEDERTSYI